MAFSATNRTAFSFAASSDCQDLQESSIAAGARRVKTSSMGHMNHEGLFLKNKERNSSLRCAAFAMQHPTASFTHICGVNPPNLRMRYKSHMPRWIWRKSGQSGAKTPKEHYYSERRQHQTPWRRGCSIGFRSFHNCNQALLILKEQSLPLEFWTSTCGGEYIFIYYIRYF